MSQPQIDGLVSQPALVVIPELRLTDKGLVGGTNFTYLPVVDGPAQ
jgi:adenine deaminase